MAHDPFGWKGHLMAGRYRIEAVVGEGGFGVVYRAHHIGLQRPVAVKCLKIHELDDAERDDIRDEFLDEGRLLHELSRLDAGVVQALDVGIAESPHGESTPYLVMEWLEGRSLRQLLKERREQGLGSMTLVEAMKLLDPVARALAMAHAQRIVHRDVKPSNIFIATIAGRRVTKLLDFGIFKVKRKTLAGESRYQPTMVSRKTFTLRYGTPEQYDPRFRTTGPWTDVFALALVLVELMTGEPALEGETEVMWAQSCMDRERRPTPRNKGVALSDELEAVFEKALAIEPEERHQDAAELWAALETALAPASAVEAIPPSAPRRSRLPYLVLALVALASLAASAGWYFHNQRDPGEADLPPPVTFPDPGPVRVETARPLPDPPEPEPNTASATTTSSNPGP